MLMQFLINLLSLHFVFVTTAHADRLYRRSDGGIVAIGVGKMDVKKENVFFADCDGKKSALYKLKEYSLQLGQDCEAPDPWTRSVKLLNFEGATKVSKVTECPKDRLCSEWIIDFPVKVDNIFVDAKRGDMIRAEVVKDALITKNIDMLTVRLIEKSGKERESMTFSDATKQ